MILPLGTGVSYFSAKMERDVIKSEKPFGTNISVFCQTVAKIDSDSERRTQNLQDMLLPSGHPSRY